jgi:hypothetical protein
VGIILQTELTQWERTQWVPEGRMESPWWSLLHTRPSQWLHKTESAVIMHTQCCSVFMTSNYSPCSTSRLLEMQLHFLVGVVVKSMTQLLYLSRESRGSPWMGPRAVGKRATSTPNCKLRLSRYRMEASQSTTSMMPRCPCYPLTSANWGWSVTIPALSLSLCLYLVRVVAWCKLPCCNSIHTPSYHQHRTTIAVHRHCNYNAFSAKHKQVAIVSIVSVYKVRVTCSVPNWTCVARVTQSTAQAVLSVIHTASCRTRQATTHPLK